MTSNYPADNPDKIASALQLQREENIMSLKEQKAKAKSQRRVQQEEELEAELEEAEDSGIHKTTLLHEFLREIKNPDESGNILDRMNISFGERPWFVQYVSLFFYSREILIVSKITE